MTREEIEQLKGLAASMGLYDDRKPCKKAVILGKAIKVLEQEQYYKDLANSYEKTINKLTKAISEQEPKTGYCKNCKYFEYDSVAKVDGIPLIVAHEICSRWGDGCKTKEDGFCFLFEPQAESEGI